MANLNKKTIAVVLIAMLFSILAYGLASSISTASNRWDIAFNSNDLKGVQRFIGNDYFTNESLRVVSGSIFVRGSPASACTLSTVINGTIQNYIGFDSTTTSTDYYDFNYYTIIPAYSTYKIIKSQFDASCDMGLLEWYEFNVTQTPANGVLNVFYNSSVSGGGGISFNGSAVDMNGSKLYNGSFDNINETLNLKVNKSGDTMTGGININSKGYSSDFDYTYDNSTLAYTNYKSSSFDVRNFFIQQTLSNDSTGRYNGFGAWKYGYNKAYNTVYPLKANELVYAFFAGGYAGDPNATSPVSGMSGGVMGVLFYTGTTVWNSTNKPSKVILYSNKPNGGGLNMVTLDENGNLTIPSLGGSGNAYVCVDSTGKLYRNAVCS